MKRTSSKNRSLHCQGFEGLTSAWLMAASVPLQSCGAYTPPPYALNEGLASNTTATGCRSTARMSASSLPDRRMR